MITGSSQGIGRALADACVAAGAHVVINARSADKVEAAVEELTSAGHKASGMVADVTDEHQVQGMVEQIESTVGPISGLINNAGISSTGKHCSWTAE